MNCNGNWLGQIGEEQDNAYISMNVDASNLSATIGTLYQHANSTQQKKYHVADAVKVLPHVIIQIADHTMQIVMTTITANEQIASSAPQERHAQTNN